MTVSNDKLVRMGEHITANMNYTDDTAMVAANVANHLEKFWDTRMKSAIKEYAQNNKEKLSPTLRAAVSQL